MNIGVIAKRYAKALLAYAVEKGQERVVYDEATTFIGAYRRMPDLREALDNPLLPDRTKADLICEAGSKRCSDVLRRFATLVVARRRAPLMLFIAHSYTLLYRELKHISIGRLTTAVPVSQAVRRRLVDMVKAHTQDASEVILETRVNERIIGGFVFMIGDRQIDASIASQFERIKKQFIEKNKRIV